MIDRETPNLATQNAEGHKQVLTTYPGLWKMAAAKTERRNPPDIT